MYLESRDKDSILWWDGYKIAAESKDSWKNDTRTLNLIWRYMQSCFSVWQLVLFWESAITTGESQDSFPGAKQNFAEQMKLINVTRFVNDFKNFNI